jgi:NADH:ubiquinone oxidoreductase subunit K
MLVAAASLCLILYSFFGVTPHRPPSLNPGTEHAGMGPRGEKGNDGLFRTLGTFTVFLGAFSYAWLRLKTKRRSSSPFVRWLVKWFDKLHKYAGYSAIVLIAVHGTYFLTLAAIKKETYSGIAAFALLFTLGVYGFLLRRVAHKYMRKVHFMLATAFALAAVIHAGGSAIMAALGVVVFWGIVWLMDQKTKPSQEQHLT